MHAVKVVLIGMLFIANSLAQESLSVRWQSVWQVRTNPTFPMEENIKNPAGGNVFIAELFLYGPNFKSSKDCLYLQVPSGREMGSLFYLNIESEQDCQKFLLSEQREKIKKGFFNFGFKFKKNQFTFYIDLAKEEFYFPNLDQKFEGVKISTLESSKPLVVKNKEPQVCFDVDDECEVLTSTCDLCQQAITPVIASNCPQTTRKYCGAFLCGTSGAPACIRGRVASGYIGPYCINDSPLAYCQDELRVICINGELVCR
ncbi:MAG: hypothetical protein CME62_14170 [Halobacteriovoraceae bacterium]|nr:hypothetical protein [Halobacteriovoraceae bacterium]|tara:strand:+ start:7657 stop:8430 length:774 start_codon:yes stop_codon:yes gene_type:complete